MSYFYTIYKITNLVNGKFYVGKHQTKNLDDNYFGSGKYLEKAIIKYGRENFKKDIIFVFDNEEEMNLKEKEIVTESFISSPSNYNAKVGGEGGFSLEESKSGSKALLEKYSKEERSIRSKTHFHKTGLASLHPIQIKANGRKGGLIGGKRSAGLWTDERKDHHSKCMDDFYAANLAKTGKKMNYPSTRKKRDTIIYEIVSCPHCYLEGKKNAMNRWHFDNCKKKL